MSNFENKISNHADKMSSYETKMSNHLKKMSTYKVLLLLSVIENNLQRNNDLTKTLSVNQDLI